MKIAKLKKINENSSAQQSTEVRLFATNKTAAGQSTFQASAM
jgi:hypothetical protein